MIFFKKQNVATLLELIITHKYIKDEFHLNENYDYVVKKNFSNPKYMVTANSNLYIAGDAIIWKTDT